MGISEYSWYRHQQTQPLDVRHDVEGNGGQEGEGCGAAPGSMNLETKETTAQGVRNPPRQLAHQGSEAGTKAHPCACLSAELPADSAVGGGRPGAAPGEETEAS